MKRIIFLTLLFTIICSSSAYALDWANIFVVWKSKVYIVNEKHQLNEVDIGKKIGEVKRQANENTGKYYGDASNIYPKGTAYHAIKGVDTSKAIAVRVDSQWLKADYSRQAPFHIMNILTNIYFILIVFSIIITLIVKKKFSLKQR